VAGHRGLVDDFLESAGDRADQIELVSNLMIVGDGPVNEVLIRTRALTRTAC
jgi:hypothetical protein